MVIFRVTHKFEYVPQQKSSGSRNKQSSMTFPKTRIFAPGKWEILGGS